MWQLLDSVLRMTSTYGTEDWLRAFACLTLVSYVVLLAFGRNSRPA